MQIPSLRCGMTSMVLRNDKAKAETQIAFGNDKHGEANADSFAALRNDKQVLRNDKQVLRNDKQVLRNDKQG
jgi:hypothetical protein